MLGLADMSLAQTTFCVMYKMYSSGDTSCSGSYQNVYNSDLNEARIDANDGSISSATCYKNTQGKYISRTCKSTLSIESVSTFSSPGCSGIPESVSIVSAQFSWCIFYNNPPLIYMGCTADESSAISKGYKDVNNAFQWILVRLICSAQS